MDGQSLDEDEDEVREDGKHDIRREGATWNRKVTDRGQWKVLMEGSILQWMDTV